MTILLERIKNIAILIIINNKFNALDFNLLRKLCKHIDYIRKSNFYGLIILSGTKRVFCSGFNINEIRMYGINKCFEFIRYGQKVFLKLLELDIPTVSIINGIALGGGLELAISCDYRISTLYSKFGFPEIKIGLIPSYGGTQILPKLVGMDNAIKLITTGKIISAKKALKINLIDNIIEDSCLILSGIRFIYDKIYKKNKPFSLHLAYKIIKLSNKLNIYDGLSLEYKFFKKIINTFDAKEGIMSFIEKRKPKFLWC